MDLCKVWPHAKYHGICSTFPNPLNLSDVGGSVANDHVTFVYKKSDPLHARAFLAGKILSWSYEIFHILYYNKSKVAAEQVLRFALFRHVES